MPVETMSSNGFVVLFDTCDRDTADVVAGACEKSVLHICDNLGLGAPADLRVYVMTSWLRFVFHPAPWHLRILLAISLPLWFMRVRRLWCYSAGWSQRFGGRTAVGIKPPRLLEHADGSIGAEVFMEERDADEKTEHVTCHELVHAFTAHLKLPLWLNEGLAQVMVEEVFGKRTVKDSTLSMLERSSGGRGAGSYRKLRPGDKTALAYHFVRGYWLTRYLRSTKPGLIVSLLRTRRSHGRVEREVAEACGMDAREFWSVIDNTLVSHFRR